MIHYMCKYSPVEIFRGFGEEVCLADPDADSFEQAESLAHSNLCGYGKGFLETAMDPSVEKMVLVSCCDVVRRLYDVLRLNKRMEFLYLLDLPHKTGEAEAKYLAARLEEMVRSFEESSGKHFDYRCVIPFCNIDEDSSCGTCENCAPGQDVPPEQPERPDGVLHLPEDGESVISLLGAHGGAGFRDAVQSHFVSRVRDDTCSGNRLVRLRRMPADEKDFFRLYAEGLLGQIPCMRMLSGTDRGKLPENARAVIYHTMKFCDYYSFEYARLKDSIGIPLLKIETDGTSQSAGQLATRLDAFAESIGETAGLRRHSTEGKGKNGMGQYFAGIDSGSASTDVVIMDRNRKIVSRSIKPTGMGASAGAEKALAEALQDAGLTDADLAGVVTTGYGRNNIGGGDRSVTEITCHAKGAFFLDPEVRTVIDIGGQDSKVIRIDEKGNVVNFVMNDKCAAGTGRFLETMAKTMEMTLPEMSELGRKWKDEVTISSMCTVFAESEVVSLIAANTPPADIIHGINSSVASKTASLVKRVGGSPVFMMTGGVSANAGLVQVLEKKLGHKIIVSEYAQLCGAIGAALLALEQAES